MHVKKLHKVISYILVDFDVNELINNKNLKELNKYTTKR